MLGVIIDEIAHHAIEFADGNGYALDLEAALDQLARPGADHVARRRKRHRPQALAMENVVEGVDQVRRGVDQRAIEIEYDNAGRGHGQVAIGPGRLLQVGSVEIAAKPCLFAPDRPFSALFPERKRR
ncbi:hypothetical protein ES703_100416 [subsurface metagenome]